MPLSTPELRKAWKGYEAAPEKMVNIAIGPDKVLVAPESEEAWKAFNTVLTAHAYAVRKKDTASYADKMIKGGAGKSLHAYGIALDLNWDTNPVKYNPKTPMRYSPKATQTERAADVKAGSADTDMTQKMIDDVLAIRTNDGARIFEWGGHWSSLIDTMHFEIDLPPAALKSGVNWATVRTEGAPAETPAAVEAPSGEMSGAGMPSSAFLNAHAHIEKWEGGFVNDPDDPGGATNFGITQAVLAQWRGRPVTIQDVRDLTRAEAQRIFHARYWRPMRCDELPFPAALMSYNCGVNSGPGRSGRLLQAALNKQGKSLSVDGSIGDLTIAAAAAADQALLVRDYRDAYEAFYRALPIWWKFGKGWMNRLNEVSGAALSASGAPGAFASGLEAFSANPAPGAEMQKADTAPVESTSTGPKGEPEMTAIDTALGGKHLVGKKTLVAGLAFAALTVFDKTGMLNISADIKDMLTSLIATYGGLSALSKLERGKPQ